MLLVSLVSLEKGLPRESPFLSDRDYSLRYPRTSVSIAKSGFQLSGGMILHSPYLLASGAIFLMYSIGFLNSFSVGLYVGASCTPCGRSLLGGSRTSVRSPRLSTVARFSRSDFRALRGIGGFLGSDPLAALCPLVDPILPLAEFDEDAPFDIAARAGSGEGNEWFAAVKEDIEGPPPVEGGTTISAGIALSHP